MEEKELSTSLEVGRTMKNNFDQKSSEIPEDMMPIVEQKGIEHTDQAVNVETAMSAETFSPANSVYLVGNWWEI